MAWIEANDMTLRYDLTGSGAETFVLIHEVGGGVDFNPCTLSLR